MRPNLPHHGKLNALLLVILLLLSASVCLVWAKAQAPEAPPAVRHTPAVMPEISMEALEDFENKRIKAALLERAVRLEDVTVTHYCICRKCCGKSPDHPAYGITASGRRAAPGVSVAVDPDVIPLGSDVLVDYGDGELHDYRADDTGSGVKGLHLDLCVESHQAVLTLGVRTATIYYIVPEEVIP